MSLAGVLDGAERRGCLGGLLCGRVDWARAEGILLKGVKSWNWKKGMLEEVWLFVMICPFFFFFFFNSLIFVSGGLSDNVCSSAY